MDSADLARLCRVARNTLTRAQRLRTSTLCRGYTGAIIGAVTAIEHIAQHQVNAAEGLLRRV